MSRDCARAKKSRKIAVRVKRYSALHGWNIVPEIPTRLLPSIHASVKAPPHVAPTCPRIAPHSPLPPLSVTSPRHSSKILYCIACHVIRFITGSSARCLGERLPNHPPQKKMLSCLFPQYLVVCLGLCLVAVSFARCKKHGKCPLPPGPKGFPIIGNMLDMPTCDEWKTFYKWSKDFGSAAFYCFS